MLVLAMLLLPAFPACAGQAGTSKSESALPEAPKPQLPPNPKTQTAAPCQLKRDATAIVQAGAAGAMATNPANPVLSASLQPEPCPPLAPLIDWYARFINGPQVKPLTPKEKARLAVRNLLDPFNGITILGNSAIYVGANAHSAYGPGMAGFGRNVGVSFTQDLTGEFFGTFLIPSIVHQDPHYHRLPDAGIKHRIAHAIYEVVWTQGDNGKGMLNYANLVGFAIDDAIGNLYVPGQHTDLPSSASRYAPRPISVAPTPCASIGTNSFRPPSARTSSAIRRLWGKGFRLTNRDPIWPMSMGISAAQVAWIMSPRGTLKRVNI